MRHRRYGLALVAAVAWLTACAPSLFQRHVEAHRWVDAAEAFARDSALQRNERALFEAALLHATPGTPVHDPGRARALLERLVQANPHTHRRATIARLLPMLDELERAAALEQRTRELQGEIARLTREVMRLRHERDQLQARLAEEAAERDQLHRALARLEADLRGRDQHVRALQTELARLKAIDLRPPERPMATTSPQAGEAT